MPLLRALHDVNVGALDAKGKPISLKKGDTVDVDDVTAAELMRHVHPEIGGLFKSADNSVVAAEAAAQAARPANIKPGNEAR